VHTAETAMMMKRRMKATAAKNEETIGMRLIEGKGKINSRKKTRDTFDSSLLMMAATARAT